MLWTEPYLWFIEQTHGVIACDVIFASSYMLVAKSLPPYFLLLHFPSFNEDAFEQNFGSGALDQLERDLKEHQSPQITHEAGLDAGATTQ